MLCNETSVGEDCETKWCECVHRLRVQQDDIVEMVFMSPAGRGFTHPIHVHGYSYRVVAMERVRDIFHPLTPTPLPSAISLPATVSATGGCHGEGERHLPPPLSPPPPTFLLQLPALHLSKPLHPPSHFPSLYFCLISRHGFCYYVVVMERVRHLSPPPPPSLLHLSDFLSGWR